MSEDTMNRNLIMLLVVLVTVVSLHVPSAKAGVESIATVSAFFTALDAGDHEGAVAMFTPDAVATLVRGETYQGAEELRDMVELLAYPGRYHNIVRAEMAGDTVTVVVDIYDKGIRWGADKIAIEVQEGKLHTYREQEFRLQLR
jgi:limonene-1,2-epoxide hydrolase